MYHYITNSSGIYNVVTSLIVTDIREVVGIRIGSIIGYFPLYIINAIFKYKGYIHIHRMILYMGSLMKYIP